MMTDKATVEFEVLGVPAPQGSKTVVTGQGRARVIEGSSKTGRERQRSWRSAVAEASRDVAADLPAAPLDGPLTLGVHFRLPMPASRPKRLQVEGMGWHSTKPDLSKLVRATEDALTDAGLIRDDARICMIAVSKLEVIGWTGAVIRIGPAPELKGGRHGEGA